MMKIIFIATILHTGEWEAKGGKKTIFYAGKLSRFPRFFYSLLITHSIYLSISHGRMLSELHLEKKVNPMEIYTYLEYYLIEKAKEMPKEPE